MHGALHVQQMKAKEVLGLAHHSSKDLCSGYMQLTLSTAILDVPALSVDGKLSPPEGLATDCTALHSRCENGRWYGGGVYL